MRNAVLSVPGQVIEPPATPTPHTTWCQPQHCAAHQGMDATHMHLIGQVADVEVWVERPDTTRPDGGHEHGTPAVHIYSEGVFGLSGTDLDELRRLMLIGDGFADEVRQGMR